MATFDNSGIHELMKDASRRGFLAFIHGRGSLEYYEALRDEGLMEEEHEADYTALRAQADSRTLPVSSEIRPDGQGGIEMSISIDTRTHKEKMINDAIQSLGDREDDDPQTIAVDLKAALLARGHGLPDDNLQQIAGLLAEGEEVIVGVHSGPHQ